MINKSTNTAPKMRGQEAERNQFCQYLTFLAYFGFTHFCQYVEVIYNR